MRDRDIEEEASMSGKHGTEKQKAGWVLRPLYALLAALQFLTIAPPVVRRPFTVVEMGRAVGYFPLVGALLGGLLAELDRGLEGILPDGVSTALVLTAWVAITGALHLDGFLDACDGLFGGHTPESRLEILRDVHVGAFGVVGAVMLLLIKLAALVSLPVSRHIAALLLAPTLGRWGMTLAVVFFPYARPEGLGRAMKDHAGWREVALATVTGLAVAWFAGGWLGLVALGLAGATTWAVARFVLARLPGLTGDVYGAISETVEVVILLLFAAGIGL